jgi:SOS-response transcriptional repressor LexA
MSCSGQAAPADDIGADSCSAGESFALQVLGDDMQPEFNRGDIVIIEPDGALADGRFVLAQFDGQWLLRQLQRQGDRWRLHALNGARLGLPDLPLPGLQAVHGVVIQKAVPGRRKLGKSYL